MIQGLLTARKRPAWGNKRSGFAFLSTVQVFRLPTIPNPNAVVGMPAD